MYAEYFGFQAKPFNVTPDPRFFYSNEVYQEGYASLLYGIRERKGFTVLTGEVGTGKTTLLRRLMENLAGTVRFVFFYNTMLTFEEVLTFTCDELNLPIKEQGRLQKILSLNEFLVEELRRGGTVALLIDEAQNLSEHVLENLRLLSNLETPAEKLLQIVLVGQPELEKMLDQPKMYQLKQRVAVRYRLSPLRKEEVGPFIHHRLRAVGYAGRGLFPTQAVERIAFYSGGIPRLINMICDNALLICYGKSRRTVSAGVVGEVARDMGLVGGGWIGQREVGRRPFVSEEEPDDEEEMVRGEPDDEETDDEIEEVYAGERRRWGRVGIVGLLTLLLLGGAAFLLSPWRLLVVGDEPAVEGMESEGAGRLEEGDVRLPRESTADGVQQQGSAVYERVQPVASAGIPSQNANMTTREGLRLSLSRKAPWTTVTIEYGSTISGIVNDFYGEYSLLAMDLVGEFNPHIEDVERVVAGEKLHMPPLSRETLLREQPDGSYRLVVTSLSSALAKESTQFVGRLRAKGYKVVVTPRKVSSSQALYRVEVVGLEDMEAAQHVWNAAMANRWFPFSENLQERR